VNTLAASHITDTSKKPGGAADLTEFRKLEKYSNTEKDFSFRPFTPPLSKIFDAPSIGNYRRQVFE